MSRWIDADICVTVNLYDDEHEEYRDERMTIAECLERFTDEGCPTEDKPKNGKDINVRSKNEPHKLSNREWKEFLAKQFRVSKTSAKEMLHGMMQWKNMDNFKRTFNPIKEQNDE